MILLTLDFIRLLLLAALIALPVSLWGIQRWMQGFAFRATLSWGLLLLPVPVLIGITVLTTAWLTLRAARMNPVQSLKQE